MRFADEYRDAELGKKLVDKIQQNSKKRTRLMEFCGGHTIAIFKYGIRQLLPPTVEMLSGPGCPVCVTANEDLDKAIALSQLPDVIITTFGDLLKVPGSYSSLQQARAEGNDIRIVYSALEALDIARENPEQPVIFIGIGFETTAPTIAASILQAEQESLILMEKASEAIKKPSFVSESELLDAYKKDKVTVTTVTVTFVLPAR